MAKTWARTLRPPSSSFFLFGMGGVGKTIWARQHFANAYRIDLQRESRYQAYLADARPEFEKRLLALGTRFPTILDG